MRWTSKNFHIFAATNTKPLMDGIKNGGIS